MKKCIFFVLCIFILVLNSNVIICDNNPNENLISDKLNFIFTDKNIAIYGNLTDLNENNSNEIQNHILNSHHVLLYDLSEQIVSYKTDEVHEDVLATAYSKQNGVMYRKTYSSNETDYKKVLQGIDQFFSEFIEEETKGTSQIQRERLSKKVSIEQDSMESAFELVEVSSGVKELKPHGKIEYVTNVYVNQPEDDNSIYIVETDSKFIPGYALRKLGDKTYKNYISSKSRQITSISKMSRIYYGEMVYGETPNVLEYWPKNQAINRTTPTSLGNGAQIGYSKDFDYSKLNETTDPQMSAATLEIGSVYGWGFAYRNTKNVRQVIHPFTSRQLVEMPNGNFNGQFSITHDFWYRVDRFLGVKTYIRYTPSFTVYAFDGQI